MKQHPDICERFEPRSHFKKRLGFIVRVKVVQNRTVVVVLFRTTFTRTIKLNLLLILISFSNIDILTAGKNISGSTFHPSIVATKFDVQVGVIVGHKTCEDN